MKLKITFLSCFTLLNLLGFCQSVLIYSEDFENGPGSFNLNVNGGPGTGAGFNQWIVNNNYNGAPLYTNTPDQNNTSGGLINFAPFSNYLHIHDVNAVAQGVSNANFNPANASNQFAATNNFCTLGMDSVRFVFYYTGKGGPGAFGEVYFSANNGPWEIASNTQLSGEEQWRYIEILNPAFNNLNNIRFGFKWENGTTPIENPSSLGVDAIRLVGKYNPDLFNIRLSIDSITPNPVCKGDAFRIYYSNPNPLCSTGFYEIQLSNQFGNFGNYTSLGIYQLNNQIPSPNLPSLPIPANLNPSACYRVRIVRIDIIPALISDTSVCIEIIDCPPEIITLMPAVVSNPLDTLCIGSVIDVPFYSEGLFINNTYTIQLSNADGTFPQFPIILGSAADDSNYPIGSIPPGSVPGLVSPVNPNQSIVPGCNYFIRIVSNSPLAIGTTYGPFCIRECDIESNNRQDVSFCIDNINGGDTLLTVEIHSWEEIAEYPPPNEFLIQVLDFQSFAIISTGILGGVEASGDTTVQIQIPILPLLGTVGLMPNVYYMRIIATNSTQNWDTLGTVIRLTIGAPNPTPLSIELLDPFTGVLLQTDGDTTICRNEGLYFLLVPFNSQSSYVWSLVSEFPPSTLNITDAPLNAILFNQTGNYSISVVETNFGCVGPGSDIYEIQVLGPPDVNILGDAIVCKGDTADYRVTLNEDSYYRWSSTNSLVIDSLNNESVVYFPQEGTATLTINALNQCGERTLEKTISVRPLPIANAGADTTLCEEGEVNLETPAGQGYNFAWTFNEEEVSNQRLFSSSVAEETMIVITVTGPAPAQCKASDTAFVFIETPPFGQLDTVELCKESEVFLLADTTAIAYLWSTGETGPVISVSDSGYFQVILFFDDQLCYRVDTFFVMPIPCFEPFDLPNAFSPNGDAFNETFKAGTTFFYNSFSIVIYNRWGQLVFESANPFFEWNGSDTNGNTLPEGTYFYVAKVSHTNNYELEKKGTVTLLR